MRTVFTIIYFLTGITLFGQQNIQLSGHVTDENGKGLDLVLLGLFNSVDSVLRESTYTDETGLYTFSNIQPGAYYLDISLLGYRGYKIPLELISKSQIQLEDIILQINTELLNEVTIKGKTPYIEQRIDRTVVTPDALISNAGKNALEVLDGSPGIFINPDGSIALKGRTGVSVFINDKPSYLSGTELENYLRSLPSGSIKQIEIMTNPPAKYDASGNAGVINIIIKRNSILGLYGNASLGFRRGKYSNSNNSISLNLNKGKISAYSNLYAGFYNSFQDLHINRFYKDEKGDYESSFSQNSVNLVNGEYINSKTGIDFYLNQKTTIGASIKYVDQPSPRDVQNTSFIRNESDDLLQRVVADNFADRQFKNQLYNIYFTRKTDSLGGNLSFDADFVQYDSENDQKFRNFIYEPSGDLTYEDQINGEIPSEISIFAARVDFLKPFRDGSRFEAGLKTANSQTDNEAIYSTTIAGETLPNYDLSNQFIYDEWINAAYVNYARTWGKFSSQLGLRAESTRLKGNQLGNVQQPSSSFTRTYTSIFPTFYLMAKVDSSQFHTIVFSYGRRINRPYYQDLNPFISPLDRFTFYSGNPDLQPTFAHNLSLSHSYRGFLNTTLNYSKTLDGINETLEIREGIYYSRPGNIADSESINLSVDMTHSPRPWYTLNVYTELGYLKFESDLYDQKLMSSGSYFVASLNNSFQLGKGWKVDVGGRYRSDIISAQLLIRSSGTVNIGVQKSILDGKGNIKIGFNDIFFTRRGDGIINNLDQTDADWNSTFDSRNVALTTFIRFGKSTSKKRRRNQSGSAEEQQRVRE